MRPWKQIYDVAFVVFYLAVLAGIAIWVVHERSVTIAQLEKPNELKSWQDWRAAAAQQDGKHGPVEREVPRSEVPTMLILMRDNFPAVLGAMVLFPALILGFFLLVLRGVLKQGKATDYSPQATEGREASGRPGL